MYSSDEINACMTEEELFKLWKTKDVYNAEYYEGNKKIEFTINHKNVFIADGIINPEIWNNRSKGKVICLWERHLQLTRLPNADLIIWEKLTSIIQKIIMKPL